MSIIINGYIITILGKYILILISSTISVGNKWFIKYIKLPFFMLELVNIFIAQNKTKIIKQESTFLNISIINILNNNKNNPFKYISKKSNIKDALKA